MTALIACDAHDYFEIVCMRRSQVQVTTHSKQCFVGIASDILVINQQEILQLMDGNKSVLIALTDIKTLSAFGNQPEQHNFAVTWEQ